MATSSKYHPETAYTLSVDPLSYSLSMAAVGTRKDSKLAAIDHLAEA